MLQSPGPPTEPRNPETPKVSFSTLQKKGPKVNYPEGPARHLDVPGQKLSPHCPETIFDSQLPSPKSSPKMPPKLSLPHRRGYFFLFQNYPCGEGNCEAIERQKLSRGNFCPGTSRCLAGPTGQNVQKSVLGHFNSLRTGFLDILIDFWGPFSGGSKIGILFFGL